jgi:hypothetical protein
VKTRLGFVSNSSSCSFSIKLEDITALQLHCLKEHIQMAQNMKWDDGCGSPPSDGEQWDINEGSQYVCCEVFMDNFDLVKFATEILGIDQNKMHNWH